MNFRDCGDINDLSSACSAADTRPISVFSKRELSARCAQDGPSTNDIAECATASWLVSERLGVQDAIKTALRNNMLFITTSHQ